MPAPCVIVAKLRDALAAQEARDVALRSRTRSMVNSPLLPSPATSTRGDGMLAERVEQRQLAPLAADVARGDQLGDHAGERAVDGAGRAARGGHAFEQVDDDARRTPPVAMSPDSTLICMRAALARVIPACRRIIGRGLGAGNGEHA